MHDCCRSRKGFGLEEHHGINDTTTIREGFFRTNLRTDDRLSFPVIWSLLARDSLTRRPAPECAIELIRQRVAHLRATVSGARPIVVLGMKLCARYGGPLLYQLVQTHTACPREVLEPLVLGSRQTDGQCRHGSTPSKVLATPTQTPRSTRSTSRGGHFNLAARQFR